MYSIKPMGSHSQKIRNDIVISVVVLEESPCSRGSIFKSLSLSSNYKFLSLSSEVQVLENFRGLSRLSVSELCAGVAMM